MQQDQTRKTKVQYAILLGFQAVIIIALFVYSNTQKIEAEKERQLRATEQLKAAQLQRDLSREMDSLKEKLRDCQ